MHDMRITSIPMIKHLNDIQPIQTSHGCGLKQVLLATGETPTNITQIAVTTLKQGETAEKHCHQTMEEYFFVLDGNLCITIGDRGETCRPGDFIRVNVAVPHSLEALTNCRIMTIGCAVGEE